MGAFGGAAISGVTDATLAFMDGERNLGKILSSAASGAISSLIGSGIGEVAGKVMTKMKIKSLSKLSKTQRKIKLNNKFSATGKHAII